MFEKLKLETALKLKGIAIGLIVALLLDNKDKLIADFKAKLEGDNPALPDEIEIPLEAAAIGTISWLVDKTILLLQAFA